MYNDGNRYSLNVTTNDNELSVSSDKDASGPLSLIDKLMDSAVAANEIIDTCLLVCAVKQILSLW